MTRYKAVAGFNLVFGVSLLVTSLAAPSLIFPRISQIYLLFNASHTNSMALGNIALSVFAVLALLNIIIGLKGLSGPQNKEKYFMWGLFAATITLLLGLFFVNLIAFSVVLPLYSRAS